MSSPALGRGLRRSASRLSLVLLALVLNGAVFYAAFWMISAQPEPPEPLHPRPINFLLPQPPPPPPAAKAPAQTAQPLKQPRIPTTKPPQTSPASPEVKVAAPPLSLTVRPQILPGPKLLPLPKPEPKVKPKPKPKPVVKPQPEPIKKVVLKPQPAPRPKAAPRPGHPAAVKTVPLPAQANGPALPAPGPAASVPATGPPAPATVKISPPGLISRIPPIYPYHARRRGLEGWVKIRVEVDAQGRVDRVVVLKAEPAGVFDRAVITAARRWRFQPAQKQGRPVAAAYLTVVRFELK